MPPPVVVANLPLLYDSCGMSTIRRLIILAASLALAAALSWQQNNSLTVTTMEMKTEKLPRAFDGYRVVHLSDLHSKSFGEDQQALVSRVKELRPDIIVFTGDIVDRRHYREGPALTLAGRLTALAPVYFVTGNQEFWAGTIDTLEEKLAGRGVVVLRNSGDKVRRGEGVIDIIGIDDPSLTLNPRDEQVLIPVELDQATTGTSNSEFRILLAHRPDLLSLYAQSGVDLVFSGHAHGGQIRLPFAGALFAPEQGFFPKLTEGKYLEGGTSMIVSRGLGNSIIPQRILNQPEILIVTLKRP